MICEAKKPVYEVGQRLLSPSGKVIQIISHYNSDGANMYNYRYVLTGKECYNALFEYQLIKANKK